MLDKVFAQMANSTSETVQPPPTPQQHTQDSEINTAIITYFEDGQAHKMDVWI